MFIIIYKNTSAFQFQVITPASAYVFQLVVLFKMLLYNSLTKRHLVRVYLAYASKYQSILKQLNSRNSSTEGTRRQDLKQKPRKNATYVFAYS